ncbi:MAG: hypothetical protein J0L70_28790 [Leptolyngbya sp. UWPOB_LEPTO1]|uniref:hypothetical protein n=1 Tax=Leptolyngbya sp. UWPOB_LEPTO1 TaxID=2815653 RepID=UPI001ACC6833|nr:hypothetical protein [Leptolyngbya sp. UWPOB_LEPTO1]MBN8564534.1 hypothetical protein [Leptolyngbya sp. UWPOB_LEPTO1]
MECLKLSELEGLTDEQIERKMFPLIENSFVPPNGSVNFIEGKIAIYEQTYRMASEEMLSKVSSGELQETQDFVDWAIYYGLLKDMISATDKGCGETFTSTL